MENIGTLKIAVIIFQALILIIGVWAVRLFNRLIKLRTLNEEGWSGILAALKRRGNLIPNLVKIASGYMADESEILTKITAARAMVQGARSVTEMASAETNMMAALAGFSGVAENYPELKTDSNMMQIQEQLVKLEERIEKSRRYYNATVRDFNMEMSRFPANIIAGSMGFRHAALFDTDEKTFEKPPASNSVNEGGNQPYTIIRRK